MIRNDMQVKGANVLVLGITFKENCTDVRNTKVVDIIRELHSYSLNVKVYDPWAKPEEVMHEYGIETVTTLGDDETFDSVILAVSHNDFLNVNWKARVKEGGIVYDVKGCLDKNMVTARL
jgi:UDP-N-acetyl-D-galactosamine dehydrogenase